MDVITTAWKASANAAYNIINPKVKKVNSVDGYEALLAASKLVTATAKTTYDDKMKLYTDYIITSPYTTAKSGAKYVGDGSV